jgi:nicotinate-nucleotide--dimethylbenzimidazole phosphoribosyltransferase
VIDLLELGAEVRATDAVAQSRPAADRLAELAGWLVATSGDRVPDRFKRVRLAVAPPPVRPVVADLAAAADVGLLDLPSLGDPPAAYAAGIAAADDEIDAGADLLALAAVDDTLAPALLVSLLTGVEPVALLPRGAAAIDSAGWIAAAVRLRDTRQTLADLRNSPGDLLEAVDSPLLAAATGVVLRAAARRTPLVLDGPAALAAALLIARVQPRAPQWWQLADTTDDPIHTHAARHLGQTPMLQLGAGRGDGPAALLAAGVLRVAVAVAGSGDE